MKNVSTIILALIQFLALTACSTVEPRRIPASQANDSQASKEVNEAALKDAFYLNTLPPDYRSKWKFDPVFFQNIQAYCQKSDYAPWLKALTDPASIAARDTFLIQKLNRPFLFVVLESKENSGLLAGKATDLQELSCASLAMQDGRFNEDKINTGPHFIQNVLSQPRINAPVLMMMGSFWKNTLQDPSIGLLILNHPNRDVYVIKGLIQTLFRKAFTQSARLQFLEALLNSPIYKHNPAFFAPALMNEMATCHNISGKDLDSILELLIATRRSDFRSKDLLDLALRNPSPGKDYSIFLQKISSDVSVETKAEFLLSVFESEMIDSTGEKDFLALWTNASDKETLRALYRFTLNIQSARNRLSNSTIKQVLFEGFTRDLIDSKISALILSISQDRDGLDFLSRSDLFQKVCTRPTEDAQTATSLLLTAMRLISENPSAESTAIPCLAKNVPPYLSDNSIFNIYAQILRNMTNSAAEMPVINELLSDTRLDNDFLLAVASQAVALRTESSSQVVIHILTNSNLTADGLDQISKMFGRHTGHLNESEKRVLIKIDAHPLATDEVKSQNKRTLNGFWAPLDLNKH